VNWFASFPCPRVGAAGFGTNGLFVYESRESNFCFISFLFVKVVWSKE
jgi:hypothetical protein